jgi:PAS domain S-box-containing protein
MSNKNALFAFSQHEIPQIVLTTIQKDGYTPLFAGNPNTCRDILTELRPGLVIVDTRLINPVTPLIKACQDRNDDCHWILWTDSQHCTQSIAPNFDTKDRVHYMLKDIPEAIQTLSIQFILNTISLQNKTSRLDTDLQEIQLRVEHISLATQKLEQCKSIPTLGKILMEVLSTNMKARGGNLYLREENQFTRIYSLAPETSKEVLSLPLAENSIFAHVVREKKPFSTTDLFTNKAIERNSKNHYTNEAFIVYPLTNNENTVIGLVSLHDTPNAHFSKQDIKIGSIIATHGCEKFQALRSLEKLQISEERNRSLVDNMPMGVFRTEPQENGKILAINPAALHMLGYTREEVLHQNSLDFYANKNDRDEVLRILLENKSIQKYETMLLRKDGRSFPVSLSGSLNQDPKDGTLYFDGLIEDITDIKKVEEEKERLQQQLRHSHKMEAIGELAGGIAHDFNNLLTVIGGYSKIVYARLPKDSSLRSKVKEIENATARAAEITKQLLTFSRKQVVHPKLIRINHTIEETKKMLERLIGENIELTTTFETNLWNIIADESQIEQILVNLVINACDAMPNGGKLHIETKNFSTTPEFIATHPAARDGAYIALIVTDTGIGIDKKIQNRIFDPFFTTRETGKGTGLGLSTVYGIVQQSGGFIDMSSKLGQGTTFSIYLPATTKDRKSAEQSSHQKSNTETILVAEDESMVRTLVDQLLTEEGYTVFQAKNGEEALNLFMENRDQIDLILADVIMPVMGGGELARRVKEMKPKIKILFFSGYTDDKLAMHGIDADMEFLHKPFIPDDLLHKIRHLLDE